MTPAAKEVRLAWDPTRLWIICHNPVEAQRDTTRRAEQLAAIDEELARTAATRGSDANSTRPAADARSTEPRSGGTPGWTASTCWRPPTWT